MWINNLDKVISIIEQFRGRTSWGSSYAEFNTVSRSMGFCTRLQTEDGTKIAICFYRDSTQTPEKCGNCVDLFWCNTGSRAVRIKTLARTTVNQLRYTLKEA